MTSTWKTKQEKEIKDMQENEVEYKIVEKLNPSPRQKTALLYQLQRRLNMLREQLQRRDLHLDLLRRKLILQEDNIKMNRMLQAEKDEANTRIKKLVKQLNSLQIQLNEEKAKNCELSTQLMEAAAYKITALERNRKIEELEKRLLENEMLAMRYNKKIYVFKEQLRIATETADQERSMREHSLRLLRSELTQVKQNLSEATHRESKLQSFRHSIAETLSVPICTSDYEIIDRLQKLVAAHRDFTTISKKYDESLEACPSRCSSLYPGNSLPLRSPRSRCTRYDDNGYADASDL